MPPAPARETITLPRGIMATPELHPDKPTTGTVFTTTHWSVVLAAGQHPSSEAAEALAQLCRTYWYPIYAFVRRKGHAAHDAQDLTQEFFARLLGRSYLSAVDPGKGRFRSFLLASLEHFLAKEWVRANRQKRGGGCAIISLDEEAAEGCYRMEPAHELTAERIFERRWAMTLLHHTLARLQEECVADGKGKLFEQVKGTLSGEKSEVSYAQAAAQLGMSEGAVKVAVHRLRRRYGELLRTEIARTVSNPEEIDEEIRYLFTALAG